MAAQERPGGGEHAPWGEGRRSGAHQPQLVVEPPVGIGQDANVGDVPGLKASGFLRAAVADEDELGTRPLDLMMSFAQLRGGFFAVNSAEMAEEGEDNRPRAGQTGDLDRRPVEVEDRQSGPDPGERHFAFI